MTVEQEPEQGTDELPDQGTEQQPEQGNNSSAVDWQAEALRWKEAARRADNRAKGNARAAADLEKLKRESMSEQERAVAEASDAARQAGYTEARVQYGTRMVMSELRAAAAGRLPLDRLEVLAGHLDLTGFLSDDGEVDTRAITEFVDGLAPEEERGEQQPAGFPDLGQGARGNRQVGIGDTDPLLRTIQAKLGVR